MKILCFSDSHGDDRLIKRALSLHPDAEVVFFLGDGLCDVESLLYRNPCQKWLFVKGNCDPNVTFTAEAPKKTEVINLLGKRFLYTHGDLYGVKYSYDGIISALEKKNCDVALFGHTHIPCEKFIRLQNGREAYLFNPGTASLWGRAEATYGIIILDGDNILFSHGH